MALQQVPQDKWAGFFDALSRQFESGEVSVDVRGNDLPPQEAVSSQPFLGISFETKGSGAGRIDIMFGSPEDANTSHTIAAPVSVLVEENTPTEQVQFIQIDAAEGEPTTIVHFLSAS